VCVYFLDMLTWSLVSCVLVFVGGLSRSSRRRGLSGRWGLDLPRRYDVVCYLDRRPPQLECVAAGCVDAAHASDHNLVWAHFAPSPERRA
jgi:hypothetical protein